MELNREAVQARLIHTLAAAVVGVAVGLDADAFQRAGDDRVTVVLGGDIGPPGDQVADRLVAAPVAVLQLDGVTAECERRSTEAYLMKK